MNNIFSLHRFLLLLRKEAADLRPKFLKIALIPFCVALGCFVLTKIFPDIEHISSNVFDEIRVLIGGITICWCTWVAPFMLYKHFNHRVKGVNYFMLPASQLEKWLSMFFYCIIITPLILLLGLILVDLCLLPLYPWEVNPGLLDNTFSQLFSFDALLTVLEVQSLFFFCNIYFRRRKMQKTLVIGCIIFVINTFILRLVRLAVINIGHDNVSPLIADSFWAISSGLLSVFIVAGMWYASFLKWKEQEL